MLWERACAPSTDASKRRKLPERCDRAWFVRSFCSGEHPPEDGADDVWAAVESVRLYNPMALLASLPPFVDQFLECTPVRVRWLGLGVDQPFRVRWLGLGVGLVSQGALGQAQCGALSVT